MSLRLLPHGYPTAPSPRYVCLPQYDTHPSIRYLSWSSRLSCFRSKYTLLQVYFPSSMAILTIELDALPIRLLPHGHPTAPFPRYVCLPQYDTHPLIRYLSWGTCHFCFRSNYTPYQVHSLSFIAILTIKLDALRPCPYVCSLMDIQLQPPPGTYASSVCHPHPVIR